MNFDVSRTPRGVKVVRRHFDLANLLLLIFAVVYLVFAIWAVAERDQSKYILLPPIFAGVAALRGLRTQTATEHHLPEDS